MSYTCALFSPVLALRGPEASDNILQGNTLIAVRG